MPAAHGAGDRFAARGGTAAVTGVAGNAATEHDVLVASASGLFECERDIAANIGTASNATSSAATTGSSAKEVSKSTAEQIAECFENVFDVAVLLCRAFDPGMTVLVIASSFVCIAEDFVGFGCFFEFRRRGFVVAIAIGMVLDSKLAIRAIDLLLRGRSFDLQHFVVAGFGGHEKSNRKVFVVSDRLGVICFTGPIGTWRTDAWRVMKTGRSPKANGPLKICRAKFGSAIS